MGPADGGSEYKPLRAVSRRVTTVTTYSYKQYHRDATMGKSVGVLLRYLACLLQLALGRPVRPPFLSVFIHFFMHVLMFLVKYYLLLYYFKKTLIITTTVCFRIVAQRFLKMNIVTQNTAVFTL